MKVFTKSVISLLLLLFLTSTANNQAIEYKTMVKATKKNRKTFAKN